MLIDDDDFLIAAFELAIEKYAQIELLGTASTCKEARQLLHAVYPDILVVDIDLPDGNGFDLIRETRRKNPMLECMVVTSYETDDYISRALEAGATGYQLKSAGPKRIIEGMIALWKVDSPGMPYVSETLKQRFHKPRADRQVEQHSKSEQEILELMFNGFSHKELAEMLNVSSDTISVHVRAIYKKLNVTSRSEAIREAKRLGFVSS